MTCACGNAVDPARWALGYHCCLSCGDRLAQDAIREKQRRVVLVANKSNYVLLTPGQKLTEIGRK